MRRRLPAAIRALTAAAVLASLAGAAPRAVAEPAADARRAALLRDLGAEPVRVRERAAARLGQLGDVPADEIAECLRAGHPRARPAALRFAAERGLKELVPVIAPYVAGRDLPAAEAAARALVTLGPDAVAAGRAALEAAPADALPEIERGARLTHLSVLDVQRRVERELLGKWRRKGGSYRGRYTSLADFGWEAQPVLLAILLDVPLEDSHVAVPATGDADIDRAMRSRALEDVAASMRRGYRTFDPLPPTIEAEELFDLAQQALCDVADLELMKEVLEDTQSRLMEAELGTLGFRPRMFEDGFAWEIEVVLAARGAPERLLGRYLGYRADVDRHRQRLYRIDPDENPEPFQYFTTLLGKLAGVLHQLDRFDEAAEKYAEIIRIGKKLTGSEPAIAGYNRACSLARRGRTDEALRQLARSLDREISSGSEDLTREWVTEDGDLVPLHSDPRFAEIVERRFGK